MARFFGAGKKVPNIKELGLYAILSYGFVSNASYATCVGLAWFAASKKTGAAALLLLRSSSSGWVRGTVAATVSAAAMEQQLLG